MTYKDLIKYDLPEPLTILKLPNSEGDLEYVNVFSEEQVHELLNEKMAGLLTERNQAADNVIMLLCRLEALEAATKG